MLSTMLGSVLPVALAPVSQPTRTSQRRDCFTYTLRTATFHTTHVPTRPPLPGRRTGMPIRSLGMPPPRRHTHGRCCSPSRCRIAGMRRSTWQSLWRCLHGAHHGGGVSFESTGGRTVTTPRTITTATARAGNEHCHDGVLLIGRERCVTRFHAENDTHISTQPATEVTSGPTLNTGHGRPRTVASRSQTRTGSSQHTATTCWCPCLRHNHTTCPRGPGLMHLHMETQQPKGVRRPRTACTMPSCT